MKEYSYYPGCSAEASSKPYDTSARGVAEALGVRLNEIPDWNCCGATTYMSVDEKRAMALSARNLALAEKEGRDLVTICNGCYCLLSKTNDCMNGDNGLRRLLTNALGAANLHYGGTVKVRHLLDVLVNDVGEEEIRSKTKSPLNGLRVAPYYGCQLNRPRGRFDDPECPTSLDSLLSWLGASPVSYPLKTKCCGGMLMTVQSDVCERLVHDLLRAAVDAEAECIATLCPLCQVNLDAYQDRVGKKYGAHFEMPIFHFTQVVGMALRVGDDQLRIGGSVTPGEAIAARY